MKFLVTGGAGFIGSNVVDALIKGGNQVVIIDDLSTGFAHNINKEAKLYQINIGDTAIRDIFENERPQVVIHLAAQTSVIRSTSNPIYDAEVNILGSLNIIINCAIIGIQKIVYASSSALYGTPEYLPVDEKHPIKPLSPYGVSKHTVEHYLFQYHTLYQLSYVALRFANVYGPRQNPRGEGGVVAIFTSKMLKNEQPVIYGSGDKSRDYIYVEDVVEAVMISAKSKDVGIFNIGTGKETYDQMIFDLIRTECYYNGPPQYLAERPGEIKRMYLNNNLAVKSLKWQPHIDLQEGISRTVTYYRSELNRKNTES